MNLLVEREEVWVASMDDKAGALSGKLAALADAGADLAFVIARRSPEKPGTGVVFVTPLRGDREIEAATDVGFAVSNHMHALRIEGRNEPGIGAQVTRKLADAGLNLRGFSGAVIGSQYVLHLAFDAPADTEKAAKVLQS